MCLCVHKHKPPPNYVGVFTVIMHLSLPLIKGGLICQKRFFKEETSTQVE